MSVLGGKLNVVIFAPHDTGHLKLSNAPLPFPLPLPYLFRLILCVFLSDQGAVACGPLSGAEAGAKAKSPMGSNQKSAWSYL